MGNINKSRPGTDQTLHVKIPADDYARLRYYLMKKGHLRGGVTEFVQAAVRERLRVVELEPATFEEEFVAMWKKPPRAYDKWCCYGAAIDREDKGVYVRQVGRFTIEELRQHHDTSRWDERTYVLVEEQIRQHQASGLKWAEQRPLIPPVPKDAVAFVTEAPTPTQEVMAEIDEPGAPEEWSLAHCFLTNCPQPQTCLEAQACCADLGDEEGVT